MYNYMEIPHGCLSLISSPTLFYIHNYKTIALLYTSENKQQLFILKGGRQTLYF